MFGRWVQENFFRYMRQEYSFDKILQYAVDEIDDDYMVVNREYSNIQYGIKKEREKLSRLKATLYDHLQEIPQESEQGSAAMKKWISRQLALDSPGYPVRETASGKQICSEHHQNDMLQGGNGFGR